MASLIAEQPATDAEVQRWASAAGYPDVLGTWPVCQDYYRGEYHRHLLWVHVHPPLPLAAYDTTPALSD